MVQSTNQLHMYTYMRIYIYICIVLLLYHFRLFHMVQQGRRPTNKPLLYHVLPHSFSIMLLECHGFHMSSCLCCNHLCGSQQRRNFKSRTRFSSNSWPSAARGTSWRRSRMASGWWYTYPSEKYESQLG